jgi:hypothetical protein
MKKEQQHWTKSTGLKSKHSESILKTVQFVLVFDSSSHIRNQNLFDAIRKPYPKAYILGNSSAG